MKEDQKDYHFISLEGAHAPRYLKISKDDIKKFRILNIGIFCIFFICSLFLAATAFKDQWKQIQAPFTQTMSAEEKYQNEIKELENQIDSLTEKMNASPSSHATYTFLGINQALLEQPYGMKDLTSEKRIKLEEIKVQKTNGVQFEFNIINNNESLKVAGFIWVMAIQGSKIIYYPENLQHPFKFTQGESFSVSKLRPVKAIFNGLNSQTPVIFIVSLFSREGDLIHYEKSNPL